MLKFEVRQEKCTRCGLCAKDCPVKIIDLKTGYPRIEVDKEQTCIRCQHCLAICPTAAISILGRDPKQSRSIEGNFPDPDQLEILIKGRRSVRHYQDENLDPALIKRALDIAWQAPTGINLRQVQFSVIDDKENLAVFRDEAYRGLEALIARGQLPEEKAFFAGFVRAWKEKGVDVLFRGAPHLVVASAPKGGPSPVPDCVIALSYFELFVQSLKIGTVWNGLVKWTINDLVPELRNRLNIPDGHLVGYAMAFGKPAVQYQRTVEKGSANMVRFNP
jgi:nitroreductase/NAD-dependent dihydropyrimidine dehydrogenase PreA subunit